MPFNLNDLDSLTFCRTITRGRNIKLVLVVVQSSTLGMSSKWISNELQKTCESSFLDCDFKLLQGYQFFIPVAFLYFTKKRHASGYPSLECDDMLCLGSVGIDFLLGICCYQYIFFRIFHNEGY